MKKKFLVSVCLVIALTFGAGHLVQADGSNQNVSEWLSKDDSSKSKAKTQTATKKEKSQTDVINSSSDGPSTFVTFLKLIFSLAIILGLIYLLYRVVSKRTKTYRSDGAIKNVGGVSVGANRSVQLIRIGDEILVVGVGDTVNLIKEITDPDTVEMLLTKDQEQEDVIQKNVSKVMHWAKGRASNMIPLGSENNGLPKTFDQQLKQLLKKRTSDVEKRLGKDIDDVSRNS